MADPTPAEDTPGGSEPTCAEVVWPPVDVDDVAGVEETSPVVEDPDPPEVARVPPPDEANSPTGDATDLLDVDFDDPPDVATRTTTNTTATTAAAPDTIHQRKRVQSDGLADSHEDCFTIRCFSDNC